jgi:anti-sigma regulatory factor (Ser/Thr protein kinase)
VRHRSAGSVELRLDPIAAGVAQARRFVREQLAEWGRDDLGDAASLVVSELVTNAVLHARSPVGVLMLQTPDGVQLQVADGSPTLPRARQMSGLMGTGRGLVLVGALSREWGVEAGPSGKVVWATLGPTGEDTPDTPGGKARGFASGP